MKADRPVWAEKPYKAPRPNPVRWLAYGFVLILLLITIPIYRAIFAIETGTGTAQDLRNAEQPAGVLLQAAARPYQVVVQSSIQDMADQQMAMARRNVVLARAAASHMSAPEPGRLLAPDERCLGGSIVRLQVVNGVPTYTQEAPAGMPVMCPE